MPPLLIDVGDVPDCHCNNCFDGMFKALAEDPTGTGQRDMWAPHDNPWLARHVENVTARFQRILEALQDAFARVLTGEPIGDLAKADPPWLRWDESAFEAARKRLEAKAPARYTLDDWMLLADYLVQRYLPDDVIQSEAEYLTVRAALLAKIEANMDAGKQTMNRPDIDAIVDLEPMDFGLTPDKVLNPVELSIVHIAKASAAENISNISADARHRMRRMIIEHVQAQVLGMKQGQHTALRQRLFDGFGQLNRDFRRIAVTEAGESFNQGFIAAQKPGQKVRRQEAYRGVCPFCKSINGMVFTVVDPTETRKNGETDVWVGKTNIGRSASPRKRTGMTMAERAPSEMWWPAAGVMHPHCRGSWVALATARPEVSPEFVSWLDGMIAKARG